MTVLPVAHGVCVGEPHPVREGSGIGNVTKGRIAVEVKQRHPCAQQSEEKELVRQLTPANSKLGREIPQPFQKLFSQARPGAHTVLIAVHSVAFGAS